LTAPCVLEQLGALEVEDGALAVRLGPHGARADGVGHRQRRVGVAEQALEQAHGVRVAGVLAEGAEDRVGRELAVLGGRGAQQDLGGLDQQRGLVVGVLAGAGEPQAQGGEDVLVALLAQQVLVLAEDDRVVGRELSGGLVAAARGVEVTCPHVQAGELHEVARLELITGRVLQLVLEQADQILDVVVEDEEAARALEREAVVGLNGESGPVVLQGAVLVGGGRLASPWRARASAMRPRR
jgi:hypothetical protein